MEIMEHELRSIITDSVKIGITQALIDMGMIKPFLTQRQAYLSYGPGRVRRWVDEGLITPVKDGEANSTVRYDRIILETLAKTSNRNTYK
jgi:hypothetical protein